MERRGFLTRFGLAAGGVGLLGGCTERTLKEAEAHPPSLDGLYSEEEVDLPTRRKFELAEEGALRAEGETLEDPGEFRAYLEDQGLLVESVEAVDEGGTRLLELTYAPPDAADRGLLYDLGIVAGGYAALVESGFEADELDVTIQTVDGATYGEFRIDTAWAVDYLDGELTAAEYAGTVADSVESTA